MMETWNFQHLLKKEFCETSQNFNTVIQHIQTIFISKLSNWVEILWGFTKFFSKEMLNLENQKVLFLKRYELSRSLKIGQDSSNRWRFAVPIFSNGFVPTYVRAALHIPGFRLVWISVPLTEQRPLKLCYFF